GTARRRFPANLDAPADRIALGARELDGSDEMLETGRRAGDEILGLREQRGARGDEENALAERNARIEEMDARALDLHRAHAYALAEARAQPSPNMRLRALEQHVGKRLEQLLERRTPRVVHQCRDHWRAPEARQASRSVLAAHHRPPAFVLRGRS